MAACFIAAELGMPPDPRQATERAAGATHLAYLATLTRFSPPYAVAIATYLPGAAALGVGLLTQVGTPATRKPAALGLAALAFTISGSLVQVRRIAIHPRLF